MNIFDSAIIVAAVAAGHRALVALWSLSASTGAAPPRGTRGRAAPEHRWRTPPARCTQSLARGAAAPIKADEAVRPPSSFADLGSSRSSHSSPASRRRLWRGAVGTVEAMLRQRTARAPSCAYRQPELECPFPPMSMSRSDAPARSTT